MNNSNLLEETTHNKDPTPNNSSVETSPQYEEKFGGDKTTVTLKLGDIVQLYAPTNPAIHEQTYFIEYIDDTVSILMNISTMQKIQLTTDADGHITDPSLKNIYILSRSEEEGYARQNHLVPKTWINIYIGGDIPSIITGEITNLDEDMIEVQVFPEMDTIYIDFAYKGIPRTIPISHFEIRNAPSTMKVSSLTDVPEETDNEEPTLDIDATQDDITYEPTATINIDSLDIPNKNVFDVLNSMYLNADGLILGEELEELAQVVEIPESQRRYGVDIQTNDLMDELLSTIPNYQRTKTVMDRVHNLIERFKQLREMFSKFDDNKNVNGYIQVGALHKPLVDRLVNMDTKLPWILPVVKQRRYLYDNKATKDEEALENEAPDVIISNINTELNEQKELFKSYYKNTLPNGVNKYENLYSKLNEIQRCFVAENDSEAITNQARICTNLDAVIDNLNDFYSTTATTYKIQGRDQLGLSQRRFVIQRYNLGMMKKEKQLLRSGKTVYIRNYMTPSDNITLKSLILLPEPVVQFSNIDLPSSSIMTKTNLHHCYFLLYKLLQKNMNVNSHTVTNFDKEIVYAHDHDNPDDDNKQNLPEFISDIKEYLLDENLQYDPEKYRKFLNVIIPKTRLLFRIVRKYVKHKLSFVEIVKELEPFMIHSQDITYKQYNEIRYFIKQKISEFKQNLIKHAQVFKNIRNIKYNIEARPNQIKRILSENRELLQMLETGYDINLDTQKNTGEVLQQLLVKDHSTLFSDIISTITVKTLVTPENILEAFEPAKLDDISEMEKIKPKDCTRRYLAKRYKKMDDLRKDNGQEDVFYDTELDDTLYSMMDNYKVQKKQMPPDEFAEFLKLSLIHKHQISNSVVDDLVKTLIEGKKRVQSGDYALLEVTISRGSPVDTFIIYEYFRRVNDRWVADDSIDVTAFLDTNTIFCNFNEKCYKNKTNNQCEPLPFAKQRLLEQTKARMKNEFDIRLSGSIEELERKIKNKLEEDFKKLIKDRILSTVKIEKYNNIAYDYGREIVQSEITVSPHWKLRELILAQDDFQKKQLDMVEFVEMYCREPMIDELNENPHWLYCLDTNTVLFPQSLFKLAKIYVEGSDYLMGLSEICKEVGVLSEDGDSVVDKHTGYSLRKIDFITQEEYTDEGMKIMSHAIMEDDLQTKLEKMFQVNIKTGKENHAYLFENKQNQMVYNILLTMANNIGISIDVLQESVMVTTEELMHKMIQSPELYEERAKFMEKKKGVRPIPYEIYKDRMTFWIVASCVFITIQTAIPSIHTKKTFPGCVQSFRGYPWHGVEDQSGIEYIACVLFKSKSSIAPWNSIEKLDLPTYISKIREMLEKIMAERNDINELYTKKREFLLLHPDDSIPEEHHLNKWRSFLPPLVEYKIADRLQPISKGYEKELMDLIRDGHRKQRQQIGLYQSKMVLHGYAIIEAINTIVHGKQALLKTSSKVPFLENACCHDSQHANPIRYFVNEDKDILKNMESVKYISELLHEVDGFGKGSMLYHPGFTGIHYTTVGEVTLVENIYKAFFHYCNFDNDLPIPEPYLAICSEKPEQGYKREWSVLEKVEFLKMNGKQYRQENLHQLMTIVHDQNRIVLANPATFTQIDILRDLLESLQLRDSLVIENQFRQKLLAVMDQYNSQKMVEEPRHELDQLKDYLAKVNEIMYYEIVEFIDKFGNLSNSDFSHFQDWMLNLFGTSQEMDTLYKKVQNIKNQVYFMSRYIPEMILNKKSYDCIPSHWDLASVHIHDIEKNIKNRWENFQLFFDDHIISDLLREVVARLVDMSVFIREFPVYSPIVKGEHVFHSLLDMEGTFLIYTYFMYSVMYEYIVCSENPDLLRTDIEETKKQRKHQIQENADDSLQIRAELYDMGDEEDEFNMDLNEIRIRVGSQEELKERVANLILAFVQFDKTNRVHLMSYKDIIKKTGLSKKQEKKRITDYLGSLPNDEREIEKQFMKFKMGQWNVGEQRGIFEYDKKTYERERAQQEMGVFTVFMQSVDGSNGVDVEHLESEHQQSIEMDHDMEGQDIDDYGEDYRDGVYYSEDREYGEYGDE